MPTVLRVPKNYQSPYTAASLPAHFAGSTITPCVCAYIVSPISGTVIGITSWSQNISNVPGYPGVTFKSTSGMTGSNVEAQQGAHPTNMEADLFLIAAGITEADALAGIWGHAPVTVLLMNYEAPDMGQYIFQAGNLGQFVQKGQLLTTELMGYNQALGQQYGKVTRVECTRAFCDDWCTLDAADFTTTGTLTAVTSQTVFRDSALTQDDDYFGNGVIRFTSGQNNGFSFHIDAYASATKQFSLRTPTPYLPIVGDTYSVIAGCRKRASDCKTRKKISGVVVNNILNHDGFPFIPTMEEIQRMPTQ